MEANARRESLSWYPNMAIEKWSPDQVLWAEGRIGKRNLSGDELRRQLAPEEITYDEGNICVTAGLTRITSLICAAGGQGLTATSGRIGAGDGSTAVVVTDTDLSAAAGSTHRWFQVLDNSTPTTSGGVITCRATFGSSDGNFAWGEWCIDIGTPTVSSSNAVSATLLNRKVASNGTKVSGAVWVPTVTITLS